MSESSSSLAVRYRPRSFSEVAGSAAVQKVLRTALTRSTLPQQLLLTGPSGTGKTTLARLVAAAVLCTTPMDQRDNGERCGRCPSCTLMLDPTASHPDLVEVDAASHGGKDEVMHMAETAQLVPLIGGRKVYIIDEAHALSGPGGTAMLKPLEEPPDHVMFILASTDPDRILMTNRSRCMELAVSRPSEGELIANLQRVAAAEGWTLRTDAAAEIVRATPVELGVRGTLMTLSRFSGILSAGEELDAIGVQELTGSAVAELGQLAAAVLAGDQVAAARDLTAALQVTAEPAVRTALARELEDVLGKAAAARDAVVLAQAVAVLASVVAAPAGSAGLFAAVLAPLAPPPAPSAILPTSSAAPQVIEPPAPAPASVPASAPARASVPAPAPAPAAVKAAPPSAPRPQEPGETSDFEPPPDLGSYPEDMPSPNPEHVQPAASSTAAAPSSTRRPATTPARKTRAGRAASTAPAATAPVARHEPTPRVEPAATVPADADPFDLPVLTPPAVLARNGGRLPGGYADNPGVKAWCDVVHSLSPAAFAVLCEAEILTPRHGITVRAASSAMDKLRNPQVNEACRKAAAQLGLELRAELLPTT